MNEISLVYQVSKEGYVEGLRRMLKKRKTACNYCPTTLIPSRFLSELPTRVSCEQCWDFILEYSDYLPLDCPCKILGKDAIYKAKKALSEWDRGMHKWQKEQPINPKKTLVFKRKEEEWTN